MWQLTHYRKTSLAAKDPLQRSPEELYEYSRLLGDEWLGRNLPIIKNELNISFKIVRWDDYLNCPEFKERSKEVRDLFKNNQEYQSIIKNTTKEYLTRVTNKLNINISHDRLHLLEEYLLEESAGILEWADHDYNYELSPYPGREHLKNTFELLKSSGNKNIVRFLEASLSKRTKDAKEDDDDEAVISLIDVMENIPQNFYWKDRYGSMMGCNQNQANILNYASTKEVIGKTDFDFYDYETAQKIRKNDLEVMRENKSIIIDETGHFTGKDRYFLSYKQPLRNKKNQIIGIIGLSVDTIKLKQQEQELITKDALLHKLAESKKLPK